MDPKKQRGDVVSEGVYSVKHIAERWLWNLENLESFSFLILWKEDGVYEFHKCDQKSFYSVKVWMIDCDSESQ